MKWPLVHTDVALSLALCSGAVDTTSTTPAPTGTTQTEVQVSVSGDSDIPEEIVVWDSHPFVPLDTSNFDVAATLNLPAAAPGAPTSTPEPADSGSDGLAWYYILMIAIGGVLVAGILALLIWYGVNSSKKNKAVQPAEGEGSAARLMGGMGGFPPPHRYSKVIQIPLVHHLQPPPGIA